MLIKNGHEKEILGVSNKKFNNLLGMVDTQEAVPDGKPLNTVSSTGSLLGQ